MRAKKAQSYALKTAVYISGVITVSALVLIVGYIVIKGVPYISPKLFSFTYTSDNVSLFPAMINTVIITLTALIAAAPIGVFSAVYLAEYAKKRSGFVSTVRITAETLSGIPSIVYGLFGYLFFVVMLGWGYSLLAGAFTLAIMVLPVIMRTTEEAIKAVPSAFREGSFALGAGKLKTVFKIVLPSAMPGILTGVVLSVGRIIAETAALIYTAGTVAQIPTSVMSSGRTMSVHLYSLWKEGFNFEQSYATAVVLLIMVIGLNSLSAYAAKRLSPSALAGRSRG